MTHTRCRRCETKKSFSIRNVLTAGLYCYPVLVPWAWNCKSNFTHLRNVYYVAINSMWFLAIGLGSLRFLHDIHDEVVRHGTYEVAVRKNWITLEWTSL